MCAACAMAAMAGASGARSWLQARHATWLTPRRLRIATAVVFALAILIPSVALSGTSKPERASQGAAPTQQNAPPR